MEIGRYAGFGVFGIAMIVAGAIIVAQFPDWQGAIWRILGLLVATTVVLAAGAIAKRASGDPNATSKQVVSATVIFDAVSFVMGGLIVVSAHASSAVNWAGTVIWSLACLGIGGLAGFVFGVPRSRSTGQKRAAPVDQVNPPAGPVPPGDAATPDLPHTDDSSPIEQISDWLTKTMVGVGLVDLRELPTQLERWAGYVASCIGQTPAADASFALGLIIYFLIVGFMGCYLLTQMFLFDLVNRFRT